MRKDRKNTRQVLDQHEPGTVAAARKAFELPDTAAFLGYVIHLPESDEFLARQSGTAAASQWLWAKTPELAHRFQDFHEARRLVELYEKNAVLALLFDLGDQYYVAWTD